LCAALISCGQRIEGEEQVEQVMAEFRNTVQKLSETRDYGDAIQELEKIIEDNPSCEASLVVASGLLDLSKRYFEQEGISKDVADKSISIIAQRGFDIIGRIQDKGLNEAAKGPLYFYAGIFHEASGEDIQALDMYRKTAIGAYDAAVKAHAYFAMCKLFIKKGMWSDADGAYQKLSSKLKKNIEHWYPNLIFAEGHISVTQPESASKRRGEVEGEKSIGRIPEESKLVIDRSRISTEANVAADFSSPAATLRTYTKALKAGDVDTMYNCFSEKAKKTLPLLQSKETFASRMILREKGREVNEEDRDVMAEMFASQIEREFNETGQASTFFKYRSGIEEGHWKGWEATFVIQNGQWKIEGMGN